MMQSKAFKFDVSQLKHEHEGETQVLTFQLRDFGVS